MKSVDGVAQIDALDNTQLAFENVLILRVKTSRVSSSDITMDLTAGGSGFYCNGGARVSISWSYNTETAQIEIKASSDEALKMATGKTFVSIVSDSTGGITSDVSFE